MNSDNLLLDLNRHHPILDERLPESFNQAEMFAILPETILDKRTLNLIEINYLFKAVNHTLSRVGAARLFHSLNAPSDSLELIQAKQEALRELASNDRLRSAVEEYLGAYGRHEEHLLKFLNVHYPPIAPYGSLRRAMQAVEVTQKPLAAIPPPESNYLNSLFAIIKNFSASPVYGLCRGPIFRTLGGIKTKSEKGFFTPALRFRRGRLSGGAIAPALPCLLSAGAGLLGLMDPDLAKAMVLFTSGGCLLGFGYACAVKGVFDNETAILPIRQRFLESQRFISAIEAVACLDELLSFHRYCTSMPHETVMPEVCDTEHHFFTATGLKNPIQAKTDKNYVGNDVSLDHFGVSFVTGPNSGGKTTYCKTIAQTQILGQIGAPVVASAAKLNIADRIAYQAPSFDSLNDVEGRFGTELRITRDIFFATTPKSLIFLDEIAEGTTSHERMILSESILEGFLAKCNNTILVTHSYELAENFRQRGHGQYLQVEFKDNNPTHRMIPGISRESHSHRVAEKIGFSPADITKHLQENGYI